MSLLAADEPANDESARARRNARPSRSETRRAILDATEALLLESGHSGFSVRKLVERCGYSAPTLYHHFRDKDGLIDALLEERLTLFARDIEAVPLVADPVENLRSLARAFALFGLRYPTHYQLLMQVREEDSAMIEAAEEARRLMEQPASQIAARGWLAIGDLEGFRQALWTMLHGIVSMRTLRPDVEWKQDLLDRSLEGIIRGWLIPEADRRIAASADGRRGRTEEQSSCTPPE